MKNIHLLLTDKSSKIFKNNDKLYLQPSHGYPTGYNLYITSAEEIKDDLDDLLDEIDGVLETNAEEFVKNYVQKGGQ